MDTEKAFHWPILGHSQIKQYLQSCISHDTLAHAYLFAGPHGVGKRLMATHLTASLLCQAKDQKKPCQTCQVCQQLQKNIHPDVSIIAREDNKKNISIQQIRTLQRSLSLRSFLTNYKIAIIDEAETMNEEAANALLKTLEEPTPQTIIILIATQTESLPATIASRCQIVRFNLVPAFQIENWLILHSVAKKEASLLTQYAGGRPGLAIRAQYNPNLLSEHDERVNILTDIIRGTITERLHIINTITAVGEADTSEYYNQLLSDWISFFRDILLYKNNMHSSLPVSSQQTVATLGKKYNYNQIKATIDALRQAKEHIAQLVNPRLVLENISLFL